MVGNVDNMTLPAYTGNTYEALYTPAAFIQQSLFLISADNLWQNENKQNHLLVAYYSALGHVAALSASARNKMTFPLQAAIGMDPGWYMMPPNFVAWATSPEPQFYTLTGLANTNTYSVNYVAFAGGNVVIPDPSTGDMLIVYYGISPVVMLDPVFLDAVRWKMLWDICKVQLSSASFETQLREQYRYHMDILSQRTTRQNRMSNSRGRGYGCL